MSRFWENIWNEAKDPSNNRKTGSSIVDDAEVDRDLIRRMKLTYQGRDENGNRVWKDEAGHIYYANVLRKQRPSENAVADNDNTSVHPDNDWQDYTNGDVHSYASPFADNNFGAGNPVVQQTVNNPLATLQNLPTVTNTQKTTNPNTEPNFEESERTTEKGPCSFKGYFYIKDKNGNDPDRAAKDFFDLLNERAGGIYGMCPDGKVGLKPGENPDLVMTSDTQSRWLAQTVASAIGGGTGMNHAPAKHKVLVRVLPPGDSLCDKIYLDDYKSGVLDLKDYALLIKHIGGTEGGKDNDYRPSSIVQAAFLGRMIVERCATPSYETAKSSGLMYGTYHEKGIDRECDILKEMTRIGDNAFKNSRKEEKVEPGSSNVCIYVYDYPGKPNKDDLNSLLINVFCDNRDPKDKNKWNKVVGSFIKVMSPAIAK